MLVLPPPHIARVFYMAKNKKRTAKDVWCLRTRETLLKQSTAAENDLFCQLPLTIRKRAICQFPLKINGRIFFADIFVKDWNYIIEVDGGYHFTEQQQIKDNERTALLNSIYIPVYRISNDDVYDKEKVKSFVAKLRGLGKHPNVIMEKYVVKDPSIDKTKQKFSKSKFTKAKKRLDELTNGIMICEAAYPCTYQAKYVSLDKSIRMVIWLSRMTVQIWRADKTHKTYMNQTWETLASLLDKYIQRK